MKLAIFLFFILYFPVFCSEIPEPAVAILVNSKNPELILLPGRDVTISLPVAGLLQEISVREGDFVDQGSLLLFLDSEEEELEVRRLEKVVEKRNFDSRSFQNLLVDDMTSKNEAMQAALEKDLAVLELERARMRLKRRKLYSPLSGRVVKINVEAGEWQVAGTAVLRIIDIDNLYAASFLSREQAAFLQEKQQVKMEFSFPRSKGGDDNRIFTGQVEFIDSRFDLSSGLKAVKIRIDNQKRLLEPGMRGILFLELPE
jgi:RND family efflux transporter MFP subunit